MFQINDPALAIQVLVVTAVLIYAIWEARKTFKEIKDTAKQLKEESKKNKKLQKELRQLINQRRKVLYCKDGEVIDITEYKRGRAV